MKSFYQGGIIRNQGVAASITSNLLVTTSKFPID